MPMEASITETELPGVWELHTGLIHDDRGFFSELYSSRAWAEAGIDAEFVQDNLSESKEGVLRGMHYQMNPHAINKFVRVLRGRIFDVAVDLRKGSPTFGRWVGRELSAENGIALWIPAGFAHGFMALDDHSLVLYKQTGFHVPESERSLNYADPTIGIEWPREPALVSDKDRNAPMLDAVETNFEYAEPA